MRYARVTCVSMVGRSESKCCEDFSGDGCAREDINEYTNVDLDPRDTYPHGAT